MKITKCDICKKAIKSKDYIGINFHGSRFEFFELCLKCAKPMIKLLKSKKLIKDEK